jgi:hypothetical protein
MNQKQSRQGDIPTKHALDQDTETFVREVLQNANDAGPIDDDEPIEVLFRFQRLTGGALESFKNAFQWNDQLAERLKAASSEEKDLSLAQFLEGELDELVLLTIEDRNTEGLSGDEDADESNYTALVRDMHRSNKEDTQGGSHGVGGTVLWAFSGISTVLFNSVPTENGSKEPPRFVGRSYLPDYVLNDELYKGYGWFGQPDPDDEDGRHVSIWSEEAKEIAEKLHTDRPMEYGTSSTVVGFREPGEEQPGPDDFEELVETFQEAAVENFWPAIRRDDLQVSVQAPEDDDPRPANLETVDGIMPFKQAYEGLYNNDGELGEPGQIDSANITFDFPDRKDGIETPDEGEVTLAVRTAGPADDVRRNEVAVFRGSGMVVQYVDMDGVAKYGSDFHAVLVCGEARTELGDETSDVDSHVERFLRAAEPAAHDKWTGTPRLKNTYSGRRVGTVEDLQGRLLRDELRELIAGGDDADGERLSQFERFFPGRTSDGGGGGGGGGSSNPSGSITRELHELVFKDDHWEFEATIEQTSNTNEPWEARVWLVSVFESGGDGEELEIVSAEHIQSDAEGAICGVDEEGHGFIRADTAGKVRLRCSSESTGAPDPRSGRIARTGVRHELRSGGD